jgi:hypothetical protein
MPKLNLKKAGEAVIQVNQFQKDAKQLVMQVSRGRLCKRHSNISASSLPFVDQ